MKQHAILSLVVLVLSAANTSGKDCLIFEEYDNTTLQCTCIAPPPGYICEQHALNIGMCMSYDNSTGIASSGFCPYELNFSLDASTFMLKLSVHNGEELNDAMCGPLNRKGLLCGRCKRDYGIALYSKTFKCVKCNNEHKIWMWLLYILLETVPVILLYFAIIVFNIRATAPPITSFLFHSQLLSFVNTISVYKVLIGYKANQTLLHLTMTVLDIWNLDALRHLVPLFCVSSSLTNFHAQVIRLVATLYPLVLVSASYIFIELHARNCKLVIILWKPFHRYFALFRRKWDPRSSNIAAFSTLVLVSLLKLWFAAFYTLYPSAFSNSNHGNESEYRLSIDPYVDFDKQPWTLLASLALIILTTVLLPTVTLCLYPTRICRKIFFCCKRRNSQTLRLFVETFQGHYKDGTKGTRDYRAVASVVFMLRVITTIALYSTGARTGPPVRSISIVVAYLLVIIALFYAMAQPCKSTYRNNMESIVYAFTGLSFFFIITSPDNLNAQTNIDLRPLIINSFLALQLVPSLVMFGKILQKTFEFISCKNCATKLVSRLKLVNSVSPLESPSEADRLVHPNQYTSSCDP